MLHYILYLDSHRSDQSWYSEVLISRLNDFSHENFTDYTILNPTRPTYYPKSFTAQSLNISFECNTCAAYTVHYNVHWLITQGFFYSFSLNGGIFQRFVFKPKYKTWKTLYLFILPSIWANQSHPCHSGIYINLIRDERSLSYIFKFSDSCLLI